MNCSRDTCLQCCSLGPLEGDDLYYNYCTGNGTLDAFAQTPDCITMSEQTTRYLNVCVFG